MASNDLVHSQTEADQRTPWIIIGGLTIALVAAYWNSLVSVAKHWTDDQYSHGFLVPIFTAVLIAMMRQPFRKVSTAERWWGVAIVSGGLLFRMAAAYIHGETLDAISFIPSVAGVFVIAGGWSAFRWSWAPVAFLIFMIPLPEALNHGLLDPLQRVATVMSTYVLQTVGLDAFNKGTQINLNGFPMNVAEQCSGLRMATILLAIAVALCMIIERPWWTKAIIILSGIPIALISNVIRIVITGLLYAALGPDSEFAKNFFHGAAGLIMPIIALGFLFLELLILDHLFIEESQALPSITGFGPAPPKMRQAPAPTRVQ